MKERWSVFREYYLKNIIIAIIVIGGLIIYYVYNRVTTKDNVLQVLMMDVQCPMEKLEEFERAAGEIVGIDNEKEVIDISFNQSTEMFTAFITSSSVDIFLMNENNFERMLSYQCLYPLDEILGEELEQKELKDDITIFRGEDEKIYGFSVSGNTWIEQFEFASSDDIIIGIVDGAPNRQNACNILNSILAE